MWSKGTPWMADLVKWLFRQKSVYREGWIEAVLPSKTGGSDSGMVNFIFLCFILRGSCAQRKDFVHVGRKAQETRTCLFLLCLVKSWVWEWLEWKPRFWVQTVTMANGEVTLRCLIIGTGCGLGFQQIILE